MSEDNTPGWRRVPPWAWLVALAVVASTFYTRVFN